MFIGRYYHTVESKGRLAIPRSMREELASGGVITWGSRWMSISFPQLILAEALRQAGLVTSHQSDGQKLNSSVGSISNRTEAGFSGENTHSGSLTPTGTDKKTGGGSWSPNQN